MLRLVNRVRLLALAMAVAATPFAAACGDSSTASGTLPPMITTTTSTTVVVTTTTTITYYKVQSGDTLSKIAVRFNVDQADLMAVNGITNPDHVELGQELKIPPPKVVVDSLPATTQAPYPRRLVAFRCRAVARFGPTGPFCAVGGAFRPRGSVVSRGWRVSRPTGLAVGPTGRGAVG